MRNTKFGYVMFGFLILTLAAIACVCGPISQAQQAVATGQAAATAIDQTLPTVNAALTLAAETGLDNIGDNPNPTGSTANVNGQSVTVCDAGDGLNTNNVQQINVGETKPGQINGLFGADNWVFQGTAGQTVTITVTGIDGADPRAYLVDPSCTNIDEQDDNFGPSNTDAQITATLASTGWYTIRIDVFDVGTGNYQVELK